MVCCDVMLCCCMKKFANAFFPSKTPPPLWGKGLNLPRVPSAAAHPSPPRGDKKSFFSRCGSKAGGYFWGNIEARMKQGEI